MDIKDVNFGKAPKVVRHVGDLNKINSDGKDFVRQETIYIPNIGLVKCAPMDNHFIYRDGRRLGWTLFCSCGSPAVVVGYEAYKQNASAQGSLLVCLFHAQHNKHADGSH